MATRNKYDRDLIIQTVNEITKQYDTKMTLRQLYYRLVAKEIIPNEKKVYNSLSKILTDARRKGDVDASLFEDRTRKSDIRKEMLIDKTRIFKIRRNSFIEGLWEYKLDRWLNQDFKIIIVLEKQALEGVFSNICKKLEVSLVVNRGYNSYTQLREIAQSINHDSNKLRSNTFLMFGDFDPSGKDIMRNFGDQLKEMKVKGNFKVLALNKEQIDTYNLPPQPIKEKDARAVKFKEEHGSGVVELDALEPLVLENMIKDSVKPYFFQDIYDKVLEIEKEYQEYFKNELSNFTYKK